MILFIFLLFFETIFGADITIAARPGHKNRIRESDPKTVIVKEKKDIKAGSFDTIEPDNAQLENLAEKNAMKNETIAAAETCE